MNFVNRENPLSTDSTAHPRYRDRVSPNNQAEENVLSLTWAVLDGIATDSQHRELQRLLRDEYKSREQYLRAVQLESDLRSVFQPTIPPPGPPTGTKSSKSDPIQKQRDGNRFPFNPPPMTANPLRAAS